MFKKYKKLFKIQKCPVCGENCITYRIKSRLPISINYRYYEFDHTCPKCNTELKLYGKITVLQKMIVFILVLMLIFIMLFKIKFPRYIFPMLLILLILVRELIIVPFSKIKEYDSTPMDDLMNNIKKVKSLVKKFFEKS